jgi:hypothetical protein
MKRYFRKNFVNREFVHAYRKSSRTRPYLSHSSITDLKCITKNNVKRIPFSVGCKILLPERFCFFIHFFQYIIHPSHKITLLYIN